LGCDSNAPLTRTLVFERVSVEKSRGGPLQFLTVKRLHVFLAVVADYGAKTFSM
jgi:hypothetical protein